MEFLIRCCIFRRNGLLNRRFIIKKDQAAIIIVQSQNQTLTAISSFLNGHHTIHRIDYWFTIPLSDTIPHFNSAVDISTPCDFNTIINYHCFSLCGLSTPPLLYCFPSSTGIQRLVIYRNRFITVNSKNTTISHLYLS